MLPVHADGALRGPMRITGVRSVTCEIALPRPIVMGELRFDAREYVIVVIETDAGIAGVGFGMTRGAPVAAIVERNLAPLLIGRDPFLTEAIGTALTDRNLTIAGRGIFARALSAIDIALWDIKGKALGVPIYELLGGPTRTRVRVYAHARTVKEIRDGVRNGFTAFKTAVAKRRPARYVETPAAVKYAVERFAELRAAAGDDVDIGIDFHGAISPAHAKLLIKGLEPHQPMFVEEPCQCQNHDIMAEIARGTHLPIATGERVFTKWGFREVLEKKAATILQPDLCHAGGITEVRLIAAMAEAYYAAIAPHNPLGPISLAAGVQIAAAIPNFLCQEQVSLGVGYLKQPFVVRDGYLDLPTGPGLGIELDENAIARQLDHNWRNREEYDADDGSVVDW